MSKLKDTTNITEQNPSQESDSFQAGKDILYHLWNTLLCLLEHTMSPYPEPDVYYMSANLLFPDLSLIIFDE